jgi:transposase
MERAVARGLSRRKEEPIKYLGVDEKNFHAGQSYVQVLTDTEGKRVVVENRDEKAVNEVCLTEEAVEAICMDFWVPYITGAGLLPNACIVHDKFPIMQYMNDAVDSVRRTENKALNKAGDKTLVVTKEASARQLFKDWYFSATHSQLAPVIKVAKMLKRHFENIIMYASYIKQFC